MVPIPIHNYWILIFEPIHFVIFNNIFIQLFIHVFILKFSKLNKFPDTMKTQTFFFFTLGFPNNNEIESIIRSNEDIKVIFYTLKTGKNTEKKSVMPYHIHKHVIYKNKIKID